MKKQKPLKNVILCLLCCCFVLIVAAAYAVVNGIYETHTVTAKSDNITLNGTGDNVYHYLSICGATVTSIHKTHDNLTSVETVAVHLLVFTQNALTQTPYKKIDLMDGSFCYIFDVTLEVGELVTQFTFTPTEVSDVSIVAVKAAEIKEGKIKNIRNEYVSTFFDLKVINDQSHYQSNTQVANKSDSYCNIWLVDNVTVETDYTLFMPSNLNLLFFTLTLKGDLTIKHSFGGLFAIEGEGGNIYSLPDYPKNIYVKAPNAYYSTSYLTSSYLINTSLDQTATEFSLTNSTDPKTQAVFSDALTFALDFIPDSVFTDILLAQKYQNFDLTYTYIIDNERITNWIPQRQATDKMVVVEVFVYFKGAVVKQAQKTVKIVGESDMSIANAALHALKTQIHNHYKTDLFKRITNFHTKCDVFNALASVTKAAQISESISITISDTSGVTFVYDENVFNSFALSYDEITLQYTLTVGINEYNLTNKDKLYIKPANFIENNSTLFLAIGVNGQKAEESFVLAGNSREELELYVTQRANTPFVMTIDDTTDVYYISDGKLCLFGALLMDINSFETIQNGTILISVEQFTTLTSGNTQIEDYIDEHTFDGFVVIEGVLSANTQVSQIEGYVYVFYQNLIYNTSSIYYDVDFPSFTVFKQIIIPVSGIGGDQYQKYLSGNTFAAYFDSLPNNKLLDTSLFYPLTSSQEVYMSLKFTEFSGANEVHYDYCKFMSEEDNYLNVFDKVQKTRGFKIDIAINQVPPTNTTVYLTVDFFTVSPVLSNSANSVETYYVEGAVWDENNLCFLLNGVPVTAATQGATITYFVSGAFWSESGFYFNTVISTQRYSFIIPGIFFCSESLSGAQFVDRNFYDAIISNIVNNINLTVTVISSPLDADYNLNNYVFSVSETNYLLADGAKIIEQFSYLNQQVNLKGIRYLINVSQLDFSGSLIESLTDFSQFEGVRLTQLNLSGCGLTDAKLGVNLYSLKYLTDVNLSNNAITQLTGILYRTVTHLNLSQQSNLISLNGITALNNLQVLDISENNINQFAPLVKLDKLKIVKLKGNLGTQSYYGTVGSVNFAEYVALLDKGVLVYASDTLLTAENNFVYDNVLSTVTSISTDQRLAALVLNGIFLSGVQYDFIIAPNTINGFVVNVQALKKQGVNQAYSATLDEYGQNKITCASITDGDTVGLILSVTVNGTTVFKQFDLLYKS